MTTMWKKTVNSANLPDGNHFLPMILAPAERILGEEEEDEDIMEMEMEMEHELTPGPTQQSTEGPRTEWSEEEWKSWQEEQQKEWDQAAADDSAAVDAMASLTGSSVSEVGEFHSITGRSLSVCVHLFSCRERCERPVPERLPR